MRIAACLQENIYHISILVNRAPEILPWTLDCHKEYVQVPDVAQVALPTPEYSGLFSTKLSTLLSNGLVGDDHPALCQQTLNISQAQAKWII
jgi:hypothetical protein